MLKRWLLCSVLWAGLIPCQGQGTILWDEAVNGPLSEDFAHPTILTPLQLGTNSIIGTSLTEWISSVWLAHADYFMMQVPGMTQVSLVGANIDRPNAHFWIGDPAFSNHIGVTEIQSDGALLKAWGIESIPAGGYGFEVFNGDLTPAKTLLSYRLEFVVEAVPEPASVWLLLSGLSGLGSRHWARKPNPRTD